MTIRVAILEDVFWTREGLLVDLEDQQDIQVIAATGEPGEFLRILREQRPHVAVIDLKIHDDRGAGIRVLQEIKATLQDIKCIMLTAFPELQLFLAAFDAGAEAFVRKEPFPEPPPPLGELIQWVAHGRRYYDPLLVDQLRRRMDETNLPTADPTDRHENPLTPRECEVLQELASDSTYSEIAGRLHVSTNTIRSHVRSIAQKLDAKGRREIVLKALSTGQLGTKHQTGD